MPAISCCDGLKRQRIKKLLRFRDRERAYLADVLPIEKHSTSLCTQPLSATIRTRRIAAILRKKHTHVQLVFLAFQLREEAANSRPTPSTLLDEALLRLGQVEPRHIDRNSLRLGGPLHLAVPRAIFRLRPRVDRTFIESLGTIRNDEVWIEVNRVAESLATRASTKWIIEAE